MIYAALFCDTTLYVEANSEEEAVEIAARILKERIKGSDFITWEDPAATPDRETASNG